MRSQIFMGDGAIPLQQLQAFDHEHDNNVIGCCVLIPAAKYERFASIDASGRDDFVGWVGKIVGYENKKKKVRIKVLGDQGFERLDVKGSAKFALDKLTRLT